MPQSGEVQHFPVGRGKTVVPRPHRVRRTKFVDETDEPARRYLDPGRKMGAVEIGQHFHHALVTRFTLEFLRQHRPAALAPVREKPRNIGHGGLADLRAGKIGVERRENYAEGAALALAGVSEVARVDERQSRDIVDGAVDAQYRAVVKILFAAFRDVALEIPCPSHAALRTPRRILLGVQALDIVFIFGKARIIKHVQREIRPARNARETPTSASGPGDVHRNRPWSLAFRNRQLSANDASRRNGREREPPAVERAVAFRGFRLVLHHLRVDRNFSVEPRDGVFPELVEIGRPPARGTNLLRLETHAPKTADPRAFGISASYAYADKAGFVQRRFHHHGIFLRKVPLFHDTETAASVVVPLDPHKTVSHRFSGAVRGGYHDRRLFADPVKAIGAAGLELESDKPFCICRDAHQRGNGRHRARAQKAHTIEFFHFSIKQLQNTRFRAVRKSSRQT